MGTKEIDKILDRNITERNRLGKEDMNIITDFLYNAVKEAPNQEISLTSVRIGDNLIIDEGDIIEVESLEYNEETNKVVVVGMFADNDGFEYENNLTNLDHDALVSLYETYKETLRV